MSQVVDINLCLLQENSDDDYYPNEDENLDEDDVPTDDDEVGPTVTKKPRMDPDSEVHASHSSNSDQ